MDKKVLKIKAMRRILILIVSVFYILTCWAQPSISNSYKEISKEYFIRYLNIQDDNVISLADTANFNLYLPTVMLERRFDNLLNNQRISPYINRSFSPHNQVILISNQFGVFYFFIRKGLYDKIVERSPMPHLLLPIPERQILGVSVKNPNLGMRYFPFAEKKIKYEQIKSYADKNPETQLFRIDQLPGIWGFKNDRLIKLIFDRKKVIEMDGEEYYRTYLFPLSPNGLQRVVNGEDFLVILTI